MTDSYRINGPLVIGNTGNLNQVLGNFSLANITQANGDMIYTDSINNMTRLAAPANTSVMLTTGTTPQWLLSGSIGQVLRVTAANTISWANANSIVTSNGFSAHKSNASWIRLGAQTDTPANVNLWSVSNSTIGEYITAAGSFDTTNGIFTANVNGYYHFNVGVALLNNITNGSRLFRLLKNNTVNLLTKNWQSGANVSVPQNMDISNSFFLSSGDQVSVQVWKTGGTTAGANFTILPNEQTYWSTELVAIL